MNEQPIQLTIETEVEALRRAEENVVHAVVALEAVGRPLEGARAPLSVVFALDVSGSMAGEPIAHVVEATEALLERLAPTDRAGVVTFSTSAAVVAPSTPMSPHHKKKAIAAVRRIHTEQSTNIEAGLALARATLPPRELHERQAILLLSDGQPNIGLRTPAELGALARSMRPEVSVSALGFGTGHDERVLSAIAELGSGRYQYIPAPALCRADLAATLGAQGDVVADHVQLLVTLRPGVELISALGGEARPTGAGRYLVTVPDLGVGARHLAALKLRVRADARGDRMRLLDVELSYRGAGSSAPESTGAALEVRLADQASGPRIGPLHGLLALEAAEEQRRARGLADAGRFPEAAVAVNALLLRVRAAPGFVANDGSPLAELVEQLVDDHTLYAARPDLVTMQAYRRGQQLAVAGSMAEPKEGVLGAALAEGGPIPPAVLVNMRSNQLHPLPGRSTTLGRSPKCDVSLSSDSVSRRHATLDVQGGSHWLRCLGSSNGVFVNGARIDACALKDGDEISIGNVTLAYRRLDLTSARS